MRPLLFLVADKNMEFALRGFFERDGWFKTVGCARFDFSPTRDIKVAAGQCDPGLYVRANELLKPFSGRYRHVVIMVDADWEGSPGADAIREKLKGHIANAGWQSRDGLGLVLEPEVDAWLWLPSPHVAKAMGWPSWKELQEALCEAKWLKNTEVKPERPKEAANWALRKQRKPRSSSIYRQVTSRVSLRRCKDSALRSLVDALKQWFPIEH